MKIYVGRREVQLPDRPCMVDDVRKQVERINPPFVVKSGDSSFAVKRRVFLEGAGLRVECEGDGELRLACKLSAEDHNQWQIPEDIRDCVKETEDMEKASEEIMNAPQEEDDEVAKEEEDITMEEWEQMGYNWFARDSVVYI